MSLKNKSRILPNTSGIYKITSPTNKIYIGQTVNFQIRYYDYLVNPLNETPEQYFYKNCRYWETEFKKEL